MNNKNHQVSPRYLGDIFDGNKIMGYSDDTFTTIFKVESDPNGERIYRKVDFIDDKEVHGPIQRDEFAELMPSGKYLLKVFDTETKEFLASLTISNKNKDDSEITSIAPISKQEGGTKALLQRLKKLEQRVSDIEAIMGR